MDFDGVVAGGGGAAGGGGEALDDGGDFGGGEGAGGAVLVAEGDCRRSDRLQVFTSLLRPAWLSWTAIFAPC